MREQRDQAKPQSTGSLYTDPCQRIRRSATPWRMHFPGFRLNDTNFKLVEQCFQAIVGSQVDEDEECSSEVEFPRNRRVGVPL
jgi:hypothetical protein